MAIAILIIEDEENIASLLKERLDEEGYQAQTACSITEAAAKLKEGKPDVITLDIYLPDGNGLEILQHIKADPETYKIPVVVVSSSDEIQKVKKLGADEFVAKPINFERLFSILKSFRERLTCTKRAA
jgi:DNA-binding response OmpR family regulator